MDRLDSRETCVQIQSTQSLDRILDPQLILLRQRDCHERPNHDRLLLTQSSAARAERSLTVNRSPGKSNSCVSVPFSFAIPRKTVPTGFSMEPPPGPAIPVTERPIEAPVR